jgi:putative membrane protein
VGLGDLHLPTVNAVLNGSCTALLLLGYAAIRQRLITLHKVCMLTALAVSALFLASYLYYHFVERKGEPTRFSGPDDVRYIYLGILLSHTVLAIVAAPLALFTAWQGLRDRLDLHVRIARWTLPIWLYVSITGVVVYWMLYRLYPAMTEMTTMSGD